jgi:hypothetical protein
LPIVVTVGSKPDPSAAVMAGRAIELPVGPGIAYPVAQGVAQGFRQPSVPGLPPAGSAPLSV